MKNASQFWSSALVLGLACWPLHGAQADVTVDASKTLRDRPEGIGGVVINAHSDEFATGANGIDFQGDLKAAKVHLVRHQVYPDVRFPQTATGKDKDLAWFDKTTTAILNAGAQPLFIQPIKPAEKLARNIYYKADGTLGGTPASNLVFMVKHYMAAPFNIKMQYWEVGNEPNNGVDWLLSPEAYAVVFNGCHDALTQAGLRENVILCGPVSVAAYRWPHPDQTDYLDYFLEHCNATVDVVTFHNYVGAKDEAGELFGHKLDKLFDPDRKFETDPKTGKLKDYYGLAALIEKMQQVGLARPHVGIGITEHNVNAFRNRSVGALWNLAVTHYFLYTPYGRLTTQFVYDDFGGQQGGLGAYDAKKQKRYAYWALWIRGNLTGDKVLAQTVMPNAAQDSFTRDKQPYLLATATQDARHIYVEVINRSAQLVKDHVALNGAPPVGAPIIHVLAQNVPPVMLSKPSATAPPEPDKNVPGTLPDHGTPSQLGANFDYEFPALSATIFEFPLKP